MNVEFLSFEKGLWQLYLAPRIFHRCLPTRWLQTNWALTTRPIPSPLSSVTIVEYNAAVLVHVSSCGLTEGQVFAPS